MIGRQIAFEGYSSGEGGLVGVFAPDQPAAELTYMGLLALSHDDHAAADIAVSNGSGLKVVEGLDLVAATPHDGSPALEDLGTGRFASGRLVEGTAEEVHGDGSIADMVEQELEAGLDLKEAAGQAGRRIEGPFVVLVMSDDHLIGMRDPEGRRPLVLGLLPHNGAVLASEAAALDRVGAEFSRELEPGELIVIDDRSVRTSYAPFNTARENGAGRT